MMEHFHNDSYLARAAYHMGEGALRQRLHDYGNISAAEAGNVARFESLATGQNVSVRDVIIHIAGTNLSHQDIQRATMAGLAEHAANKSARRNGPWRNSATPVELKPESRMPRRTAS